MDIRFYNIQGFRGDYRYTIDDLVTIINSKHNGVGKTTLFDCLRFLCDSTQVDKEEQEFFLNIHESEGLFSVTVKDVTHGFVMYQNKPAVFFRQIGDEDVESSPENFITASQDIGILAINDALLNIFSKEVDLFSSSNTGKNYQLVKEITTHQQTEDMLDLLERSININKVELSNLRAEKKGVDAQVQAVPYYFYVNQLEELLSNDFYEDLELTLESMLNTLNTLKEVHPLNFNSGIENFILVEDTLSLIQATDFEVPNADTLEYLEIVSQILEMLQPMSKSVVSAKPLESLLLVEEILGDISVQEDTLEISLEPLEALNNLLGELRLLQPMYNIEVSADLPSLLSSICIRLGQMTTAYNQEKTFNRLVEDRRSKLSSQRVSCPIREEVYLVNGKCVY